MNKKVVFEVDKTGNDILEPVEFEIQAMDYFIYQKHFAIYQADKNSEKLAIELIKEMVVSPSEANKKEFWKFDPSGLDVFAAEFDGDPIGFFQEENKKKKNSYKISKDKGERLADDSIRKLRHRLFFDLRTCGIEVPFDYLMKCEDEYFFELIFIYREDMFLNEELRKQKRNKFWDNF